jgi:serine protease AprX
MKKSKRESQKMGDGAKETGPQGEMPSGAMEGGQAEEMPIPSMESQGESNIPEGKLWVEQPGGQMLNRGSGKMPGEGDFTGGSMPEHQEPSEDEGELENVLVELRVAAPGEPVASLAFSMSQAIPGFELDTSYDPVPVSPPGRPEGEDLESGEGLELTEGGFGGETVIVRGRIDPQRISELESRPEVVKVWKDTPIAPFTTMPVKEIEIGKVAPMEEGLAAPCPFGTCDCTPGVAKGTIADVANYLGASSLWAHGYKGDGVVVGVVDGGITAHGRPVVAGESPRIHGVTNGYPSNWGTTAAAWGDHGNMCATDVLGMAPDARIYDIRISNGNAISAALAGFQWAINQHRVDGTPHILTNSWGIFQESWDPAYARDPNHPFTRKVVEAINEGIIVLFAAGNCGANCPDGRCASDSGPGRSIWGANSHPAVMTVGAVNLHEQLAGYSSQGPGALSASKPDFCSITHFRGYFGSDSGTSAATPVTAGIVALMKQARPALTHAEAKDALIRTAKDIGPAGWDQHSGQGIIRGRAALEAVAPPSAWRPWVPLGGFCTDGVGVSSWGRNRLDCFVIGNDRALWHKWWAGSAWSGWESLGGHLYSNPAAVSWGPNRIDVFAIGGDHQMWHRWWDGSAWRGWEGLGGFCTDGVGVSSWGPNRLDCFVIGNDRALWHKWWNGSAWSGWESLGGHLYSNPAAVSWGPNRIDVFAIGGDHAMWHKWWNGSAWSGWESLGGFCTDGVGVSAWGDNRLDCFVVGNDRALWHKWWNGSAWSGWESLGGNIYSNPAAVSWGPNRIDVFALGGDRQMWQRWWG